MNIKITYNWLLEYLDTDATPEEIQKYLSLCGPSIEKVLKTDDDYVFDIEITSNRVDMASVIGIAREASAILPRFGKKAVMKEKVYKLPVQSESSDFISITDENGLTKRIMAVLLEGVKVEQSPSVITKRLEACDIRSLNNLIDVTNYVMLEIGHPTHIFDYDRIKTNKLVFRTAKTGEKIVTLDGKNYEMQGFEEVIDDGTGRIIDLPGIMGTENSVVTTNTNRALFFVDNNEPTCIRKTSMTHAVRTMAATYNEKNPDPELAEVAMQRGLELFNSVAHPTTISNTVDIYSEKIQAKTIAVHPEFIAKRMGVSVEKDIMINILSHLGFSVEENSNGLNVTPPSFRAYEVLEPEDVVEEIARVYGYHNLPNVLQPTIYIKQPDDIEKMFMYQNKIKYFLKHLGLNEVLNYSMISKKLIEQLDLDSQEHLVLKNSISEEVTHMRRMLMPSLIKNIADNEGKQDVLRFFEIAKTYKPIAGSLPLERFKLGIVTNTSYADIKGISEALLRELNIENVNVEPLQHPLLSQHIQAKFMIGETEIGEIGQLKNVYQTRLGIKTSVYLVVFELSEIITRARTLPVYRPINTYATIKLDLTIGMKGSYRDLVKKLNNSSQLLSNIELISTYKDSLTLRFYFSSQERNITVKEAEAELEKIKKLLTE